MQLLRLTKLRVINNAEKRQQDGELGDYRFGGNGINTDVFLV